MLQWLVNSGDRPRRDPPVGAASSDLDDDDPHRASLEQVRSRRRRRLGRRKIRINPTQSSNGASDVGSDDDDDHSSGPIPGALHFDDDDATHNFELEACGSMFLEAVSMNSNRYSSSTRAKAQPWKHRLLESKPNVEPEGVSPRTKLLKRMKGEVDIETKPTTKIDPLPSEVPVPRCDFDDEVLEEAMKMAAKNLSLKRHSNLQRIMHESDSSDAARSVRRGGRTRPPSAQSGDPRRSDSPGEEAVAPLRKPKKHREEYLIDSDNSILQSRTGSDVDSSDASLFQTLQRAMDVQRAGRPSPPASPLTQPRHEKRPEQASAAVQSTLDCDVHDDLIMKSRTPRSHSYRSCPTPERLRTPLSNSNRLRRQDDTSPTQRKRRSRRRMQGLSSRSAGSGSISDDEYVDKYATSWRKKQRVVSPTHSNAAHTISTQRRSNVAAQSKCTALPQPNSIASPAVANSGVRSTKSSAKSFWKTEDSNHMSSRTLPDFLPSNCPDLILPGKELLTSMQPSPRRKVHREKAGCDQAMNSRCLKSRQARGVQPVKTANDDSEEEPSKADILARRKSGLRKASLVDDSSAFGTTDDEGQKTKVNRGLGSSQYADPCGRGTTEGVCNQCDAPLLERSNRFRREVSPRGASEKVSSRSNSLPRKTPEDFDIPSPVQSVDEDELDMLSLLSGECARQAEGRGSSNVGWRPGPRHGETEYQTSMSGASHWSAFQQTNTSGRLSDFVHDESRISPLLVPQRRKSIRPPKPEKRKSRDCKPDVDVVDLHLSHQSAPAKSAQGDFEISSVFSGEMKPVRKPIAKDSSTTSRQLMLLTDQTRRPPAPERLEFHDYYPSRNETQSGSIHNESRPCKGGLLHSKHFHRRDHSHWLDAPIKSTDKGNPYEAGASVSFVIVPGSMDNPIVIGDELISFKSKHLKRRTSKTVDSPCDLFPLSGDCACIVPPRGVATSHPVPAGSLQNPIIITDANDAIQASRRGENSILKHSIEVNRTQYIDSLHQLRPLDVADDDSGSDRENHRSTRIAEQLQNNCTSKVDDGCSGAASNGNSNLTRHHSTENSGGLFRGGQVTRRMRSPSALKLGDHEPCSSLKTVKSESMKPALQYTADDCAPNDCGFKLDVLDFAGSLADAATTGHQPNGDSAMNMLHSELERQFRSSKGVVLFKPNICIYTKSGETSKEPSDQSRIGGSTSVSSPAIRDSLDKVSLTIAKLEEKVRQVDFVLSRALVQVHHSLPKPTKALDVDDDDGMTLEMDRLSRCEEELRAELNATQEEGFAREAHLPDTTQLLNDMKHFSPSTTTRVSPPLCHEQPLSPVNSMDKNGFYALFPVDLTDVNDGRSLSSCSGSSSRLSDALDRITSIEDDRRDNSYDAIPPLRRLRDQERTSRRRMKTRVSSILHLVDPDPDEVVDPDPDEASIESDLSRDLEVGPGIVVLHHRNHKDVEIMLLPEHQERQPDDSAEEIEVIFVEESFLSTDSFSFGETKGVYFDWKRSAENEVVMTGTDHAKRVYQIDSGPNALLDPKNAMIPREGGHVDDDKRRKLWTDNVVQDMIVGLPSVFVEARTDNACGRDQLRSTDESIRYSTANEGSSRRATSDPPSSGLRASLCPGAVSPELMTSQSTKDASDVEIQLPGIRSGALSDVFSGIDDSVRYRTQVVVEDEGKIKETPDDELKRRVEGIMRRSERSKRNGVRVLEPTPVTGERPDAPSQASSSMMDDEEDESSLSLTLSNATKGSVTSNTSLASVASVDAEDKLRALISRGKALVAREQSKRVSSTAHLSHQFKQLRESDSSAKKCVTEGATGAPADESSSGEVSEWAPSLAATVAEEESVKSPPVQLYAEVKRVRIPKVACRVDKMPPPAPCPSSRRLARLRRLQNNWTISANGFVVPKQVAKQGATTTQVPEMKTAQKSRYGCDQTSFANVKQSRFAKVKQSRFAKLKQSNVCDETCSTLTPSVRRDPVNVARYMPAIRMSSMLARDTTSTAPALSPNLKQNGATDLTAGGKKDVPAKPAKKRKSILGQLHLSKLLSKTKRNAEVKATPYTNTQNETGRSRSPKEASPGRVTHGREVPVGPEPTTPNNPFDRHVDGSRAYSSTQDNLSRHQPVETWNTLSPTKRRLRLSRMPDFPDLLHPSLRSVVSYPPMSDNTDATMHILSTNSFSPRSLKALLPSHVRARNVTSALPGSLLWQATHESADDA